MKKLTQKYTIVALLEDTDEGYQYSSDNWPLHVTIADTFSIELELSKFIQKLAVLANSFKPVVGVGSHTEYFGPEKDIQVTILGRSKELIDMHYSVINLLKEAGVKLNNPQYSESGFIAHATVQQYSQVKIGEEITVNNLALIDMFPNGNPHQRKVLKVVNF